VRDRGTRRRRIAEHAFHHADYGSALIGIIAVNRPYFTDHRLPWVHR